MANLVLTLNDGWDKYQRILRDPSFIGKPRTELLSRSRRAGLREAKAPVKGRGLHRQHHINAHDSMRARFDIRRGTVTVRTLMPLHRAQNFEAGGGRPALIPLFRWAKAVGHPATIGLEGIGAGNRQSIRQVQWPNENWRAWRGLLAELDFKGQPAFRIFAGVANYWRQNVPRYLDEMARKLEARWRSAA